MKVDLVGGLTTEFDSEYLPAKSNALQMHRRDAIFPKLILFQSDFVQTKPVFAFLSTISQANHKMEQKSHLSN